MNISLLTKEELVEEVKRLEKENKQIKQEQAKILGNVKILISKLSHELKTPLNSIIGFGELFRYKTDDLKLISYADNILTSSKHMLSLVMDIFDVSSSQYKTLELSYSIFNTKDCIEDVISSFCVDNIGFTLSDITICADYTRFKQLVFNLVSNAQKFSDTQGVKIITYFDNDCFCFEITNTGEVIPKSDFSRIFELYSQISSNPAKRALGSGIGLALCKAIVNAHNGNIEVLSSDENGTTFAFRIPIDKQAD